MSKASEWARQGDAAEFPAPKLMFQCASWSPLATVVQVLDQPQLLIRDYMMTAEDALALARWILDTFGEPPEPA